jgi:hypothetical protein
MQQKKPTVSGILFEVLFGALVLVIGILQPAFIMRQQFVQSMQGSLGDTIFRIVLIGGGAALMLWGLFQLTRLRRT